jgi:broad specificity phosphatase PhoE
MTLLALLRHGETQWSRDKLIQGRTDVPLNAAGRSVLSARRLPGAYGGARVVSSPLARCVQTAQVLGLEPDALEPRIAEMSWGEWEGLRIADLRVRLGPAMAANEERGFDFMPPGGESPRQVAQRVGTWMADIARADVPTVAVTHRGVIRVVFATACGWDMRGRPPAKLDWGALHVFRLDQAGNPSVLRLNVALDATVPGVGAA